MYNLLTDTEIGTIVDDVDDRAGMTSPTLRYGGGFRQGLERLVRHVVQFSADNGIDDDEGTYWIAYGMFEGHLVASHVDYQDATEIASDAADAVKAALVASIS